MTPTYKYCISFAFWKLEYNHQMMYIISYISIYDGHGLIIMYNTQILLHSYYKTTYNESKYISITFNIRTRKDIHIICVYKNHFSSISMFLHTLETLVQKSPNDCPFIVLRDFNI
jgi:hypothetical protein